MQYELNECGLNGVMFHWLCYDDESDVRVRWICACDAVVFHWSYYDQNDVRLRRPSRGQWRRALVVQCEFDGCGLMYYLCNVSWMSAVYYDDQSDVWVCGPTIGERRCALVVQCELDECV